MEQNIGGVFALESLPSQSNHFLHTLAGENDQLFHMMSGRCGIMFAVQDWMRNDLKRVAYLPAYTCETVSGCFVKSGYEIIYYDVDKNLRPLYDFAVLDKISLVSICGYFGFTTFDEAFIAKCRQNGIGIIVDATHSIFSEHGTSQYAHYTTVSFRKWFGVPCGGLVIKHNGRFFVKPTGIQEKHMEFRYQCFKLIEEATKQNNEENLINSSNAFWDAEMLLREVYGTQESDQFSEKIVTHYPIKDMRLRRQNNYSAMLAALPRIEAVIPVFRSLPPGICPSHFPVYVKRRDEIQHALLEKGVKATVYWPVPPFIHIKDYPGAQWVYEHILALPCDQRYTPEHMERVAACVANVC